MANIRPDQLPAAGSVNPASALVIDDGANVEKATPIQVVDAAIPLASQAEAETGADNAKRVTPLRVKQAIDAQAATIDAVNERPTFTELASTAPGEGADLIATSDGSNVNQAIASIDDQINNLEIGTSDNLISQFSDDVTPEQPCAIVKTSAGYELYSPLSLPGFYALDVMERTTSADYRPTSRSIVSFSDVYQEVFDGFTRGTGGELWSSLPNTQAVGGVYSGTAQVGQYTEKEITLTGVSTVVGIIYASRNSCHHISVTINGSTDLVNLLPTNSLGEKYVDGYSADTTANINQRAAIAVLPAGTYTIRMTSSAEDNPASVSGIVFYPQGLFALGGNAGLPWGPLTHAPEWTDGEEIVTSYQRWWQGISYRATTSGTTAGTSPLDDSGVSWEVVEDTYAGYSEKYLRDVSEPFWAIWLALNGQPEEDFGGDIHGGVSLDELIVSADGLEISLTDFNPIYARRIAVVQKGTGTHSTAPGTPVFTFEESYTATPGGTFGYRNILTPLFSGLMGLYYPGMLPIYHYNTGQGFRYQLRRAMVQNVPEATPSDYYGISNPAYGNNNSLQIMGLVDIGSPAGSGGVPAVDKAGKFFAAVSLEMTRASLLNFDEDGGETYWDMNTGGADPSSGGFTGMLCKGYFRAKTGSVKRPVAANDPIVAEGFYRVRLFPGSAGNP